MTIEASLVTTTICGIIVMITIYFWNKPSVRNTLPNIVSILGVFGTFVGIFIGLLDFDTQDIEKSVPQLLDGLKTAFITSIFGMGAALIIRINQTYKRAKEAPADEKYTGATIDTLAEILGKIQETQQNVWEKAEKQLQGIEKSLVGDGDTTLLTQLQKLRTSVVDKQDELIKEFREFAKTMAEQNSKSLIEALEAVMRDFNTKINEQFGDNFKQLNEAVGKILEWQEQYRKQIEEMTAQYQRTVDGIEEAKKSLTEIVTKSNSLVDASQKLQPLLDALDKKQVEMEKHLEAFSKVAEEAQKAIPIINEHLKNATDKITKSLTDTSETVKSSVELNLESMRSQSKTLTDTASQINSNIDRTMTSVSNNVQKMIDESGKIIQEQIKRLDQSLEEELTKSLNTMGSQLATLSGKFVEDYTPLTERLREIIRMIPPK